MIWHWFLTVTGSNNTSGVWYGFWSGFGSDLAEFALIGSLAAVYRRNKCTSCWRLAHYSVANTPYRTCHRHMTSDVHDELQSLHKQRYPQQHFFLKSKDKK